MSQNPIIVLTTAMQNKIRPVVRSIQCNTTERCGPVSVVAARMVGDLLSMAFQKSKRHKSGVAVLFSRNVCWRQDKTASEEESLYTLAALLACANRERTLTGIQAIGPDRYERIIPDCCGPSHRNCRRDVYDQGSGSSV